MNRASRIQALLMEQLQATSVQIEDQSHQHQGHQGRDPLSTGGHFEVTIVSPLFTGQSLLQRHRLIYDALSVEMGQSIHALSIKAYSPDQWEQITP